MPNFNFDKEARRAYQEPQTTKNELLRPPQPSGHPIPNTDWNTPPAPVGLANILTNTWSFKNIDRGTNNKHAMTPLKTETPLPGFRAEKRLHDSDVVYGPSKKRRSREREMASENTVSGNNPSNDQHCEMDVIDLCSDEEGDKQETTPKEKTTFPERQFVPRAEENTKTPDPKRRKSPSPPRTFIRGFSPIAAHPRKPPLVSKSRPPIKPVGRRSNSKRASATPAATSIQVFQKNCSNSSATLPTPPQLGTSAVRDTPLLSPERPLEGVPATLTPISERIPRKGPFLQDDASSSDEDTPMENKHAARDSLESLVRRPKHDTPARQDLARMKETSKSLRVQAQQKTQQKAHNGVSTPDTSTKTLESDPDLSTSPGLPQSFLGTPHQMTRM